LFFGPGGKNPESIVSTFSKNVQRAAFKVPQNYIYIKKQFLRWYVSTWTHMLQIRTQTSSDRIQKLFGRQDKGIILRASEQQIRELRRHASEGGHGQHWPFGETSRGPYSLLDQRPRIANRHGQLYEADARSFRDLAEHDVRVSFVNITAVRPLTSTMHVYFAALVEFCLHT
jgi:hypothetical protein